MANLLAANDDELDEISRGLTREDTRAALAALRNIKGGLGGCSTSTNIDYSKLSPEDLKEFIILQILDKHKDISASTIIRRIKEELWKIRRFGDFELIKGDILTFFKEYRQQLMKNQLSGNYLAGKQTLSTKERFEQVLANHYIASYEKSFLEGGD